MIFNPKSAPVQDQSAGADAAEDHANLAGPADEPADKGDEVVAEPDVKKAKVNSGPSFGRRACPKTSPASERWKAVRHVYLKCIMDHAIGMGFGGHSYEVRVASFPIEIQPNLLSFFFKQVQTMQFSPNIPHFKQADWWSWCAAAFAENGQLQSLGRSDSPDACYAMFVAAAKEQLQPFMLDAGLTMSDED